MKKRLCLAIGLLASTSCQTPKQAANVVCDCLHETARDWENDKEVAAVVHFAECSKDKDDLKKQFSGPEAIEFEAAFDTCLRQTVSSELLYMLFQKEERNIQEEAD